MEPWRFFGLLGFDIDRVVGREVVASFLLFSLEASLVAARWALCRWRRRWPALRVRAWSTAGAGGAGGQGCVGTLGSVAGRGEGVVLGGDGTLGSAAGTDIGSGSKPGGTVGGLATVVGVGILAGPGSVIALKLWTVVAGLRVGCH